MIRLDEYIESVITSIANGMKRAQDQCGIIDTSPMTKPVEFEVWLGMDKKNGMIISGKGESGVNIPFVMDANVDLSGEYNKSSQTQYTNKVKFVVPIDYSIVQSDFEENK